MANKQQAKKNALRDARKKRREAKTYLKDNFEKIQKREKDAKQH